MASNNNKNPKKDEPIVANSIKVSIQTYFSSLIDDIFHLEKGVNKKATVKEIKSKQSMSGANAWMLFCSIMIASIGLNLDSQAVIIGGMLISPLMSPILGIGLGVATNDKDALNHALMHFGAAIIIALIASTFYFWITPLDEFTPQIAARTEPTFLDVLIAVFGGVAGIISIARKDISTTLPGVAIATALMPPLCVAGYGLANANFDIALKAFYLFFLNSFFVAFTTYMILRVMNFPHKVFATKKERRKNFAFISFFSILVLIPSFLIFKSVFQEYNEKQMLEEFLTRSFPGDEYDLIDGYKLIPPEEPNKLLLKVYGNSINDERIEDLKVELADVGLAYITDIDIIPTSEIDLDNLDQLKTQIKGIDEKYKNQINQLHEERLTRDLILEEYKKKDDFFNQDSAKFRLVCDDLKIFFPDINEIGFGITQSTDFNIQQKNIPTVIVNWKKSSSSEVEKLTNFIKKNYKLDSLKVVIYD